MKLICQTNDAGSLLLLRAYPETVAELEPAQMVIWGALWTAKLERLGAFILHPWRVESNRAGVYLSSAVRNDLGMVAAVTNAGWRRRL